MLLIFDALRFLGLPSVVNLVETVGIGLSGILLGYGRFSRATTVWPLLLLGFSCRLAVVSRCCYCEGKHEFARLLIQP